MIVKVYSFIYSVSPYFILFYFILSFHVFLTHLCFHDKQGKIQNKNSVSRMKRSFIWIMHRWGKCIFIYKLEVYHKLRKIAMRCSRSFLYDREDSHHYMFGYKFYKVFWNTKYLLSHIGYTNDSSTLKITLKKIKDLNFEFY